MSFRLRSTSLWIAATGFCCGILGLLLVQGIARAPFASAQSQQRFEYKVLSLEYSEYREQAEWKEVLKIMDNNEWRAVGPFHEAILNSWAQQGWELERMTERKAGSTLMYLRRRKR